ncbi:MAG: hypothetical protein J6Q73_02625 [Bacteroidaceae bacterium]|nr:hypothetical protein [Bacteroidaceae bacterium]
MKNRKTDVKSIEYWLALSEKYFDAQTTNDEERALARFLTTPESNHTAFNEIKAVMGYLSTGRSIAKKKNTPQRSFAGKVIQWAPVAASVAVIAVVGTVLLSRTAPAKPAEDEKETYYAYINGKEYTDEEFVMQHMLATMNKMSSSSDNVIEEQMGAMFRINN